MRYLIITLLVVGALAGVYFLTAPTDTDPTAYEPLPILGFQDVDANGKPLHHTIPDFSFMNQDSSIITNKTFANKAYVSDFFFIHCPSICPRVKAQMLRIYEKFEDNDNLVLLSHSIDTRNDTVPALKAYAKKLQIKTDKWHLVTGEKDLIFTLADEYFVAANEDPDAPGGFDHSGRIILVDQNRHVRAFAEGTEPDDVTRFLDQLEKFLAEEYPNK